MKKICLIAILPVICFVILGCNFKNEVAITGATMGTTYHVKVVTSVFQNTDSLKSLMDQRLVQINQSMSTFIPDSEISRFNDMKFPGADLSVSDDFINVMKVCERLYRWSDGAWDGTVAPLVDLWGFGPGGSIAETVPTRKEIAHCLKFVGFSGIKMEPGGILSKTNPGIKLDLASIAKGYGVDAVAEVLREQGFHNFIVEIGGEVFAEGVRKDGKDWRVGINLPRKHAAFNAVYHAVDLKDKAMATSGDYRNYFDVGNREYTHIIDPHTGYPISNGVVSVSVIADTCTEADGLATAMMVMGPEKSLVLAKRLADVQCLVVVRQADGSLKDYRSKGFTLDDKDLSHLTRHRSTKEAATD